MVARSRVLAPKYSKTASWCEVFRIELVEIFWESFQLPAMFQDPVTGYRRRRLIQDPLTRDITLNNLEDLHLKAQNHHV